jgi:ribosomal protein S8
MAEFTKEMYDDLKKKGYINDEPYINKMSHEISKELSDRLSQKTEIIELNYEIQRKIILGEI